VRAGRVENAAGFRDREGAVLDEDITEARQPLPCDPGNQDSAEQVDVTVAVLTVFGRDDVRAEKRGYEVDRVLRVQSSIHFELFQFVGFIQPVPDLH
jgi:hypothetical protein